MMSPTIFSTNKTIPVLDVPIAPPRLCQEMTLGPADGKILPRLNAGYIDKVRSIQDSTNPLANDSFKTIQGTA